MNRMDRAKLQARISRYFNRLVHDDLRIEDAFLMLHSDRYDIHLNMADSQSGTPSPFQPYYVASVGKTFTAVLIAILSEHRLLSFDDHIADYLDDDLMNALHVYKGRDYSREIRIRHLLNHTSGLHDYFGDKPGHGKRMLNILLDEPSRRWTPAETVKWSKENLKSHFPPGKGHHYSDTGYHLLGLIIEKVTSRPFHEALSLHIFRPLGMVHSCLWQHSQPDRKSELPVSACYVGDKNVINYTSLSIDYAGGGIVSTSDDLLKFMSGLTRFAIIRKETFEKMKDWAKFFPGVDYGYGIMNIRGTPIIMPRKYSSWGNAGSTGSLMFYHPRLDLYLIGSLNRYGYHRKAFRLMFKCIDIFSRYAAL